MCNVFPPASGKPLVFTYAGAAVWELMVDNESFDILKEFLHFERIALLR